MRTPFVIAEFASSHDGDLDRMLRGIATAKECDADAFKTAWCSSAERVCARMSLDDPEAVRVVQWPSGWLPILASACKANGLEFLCTVDLAEDIGVVAPFVDRFKIASWGFGDEEFQEQVFQWHKPVIRSAGASDIRWGSAVVRRMGARPGNVECLTLHCVSAYPTPVEDVNLAVIREGRYHGFSDHTRKVLMGALAVAAGARILEVHFCLPDTAKDNADRCVSHEPDALTEYIALARKATVALGDGRKRIMPSEEKFLRHRYSIP